MKVLASAAVTLCACLVSGCGGGEATSPAAPAAPSRRPNIVLILTDDLDARLDSIEVMPQLRQLVTDRGTAFDNAFVTVALCCPSRTTILRGQYAQNTEIFTNSSPGGGFVKMHESGLDTSTAAVWLRAAGYRTALFGKYLNGYPERREANLVPPGWDEWMSPNGGSPYGNVSYQMNDNGKTVAYGPKAEDYMTDVLARRAAEFVQRAGTQPFFMYLATYAPHGPATPAPRHQDAFAGATIPRPPNFNEADVSDKPLWVRSRPLLDAAALADLDALHRKRLQSLLAVDDLIATVVRALESAGTLGDTYLFFTSDNGFHLGEHRQESGKQAPYEEEMRVPLLVRGPGVPAGRRLSHLVGNVDLAPTFLDLASGARPDFVDGRSLRPLLAASPPPLAQWRQAYLIMHGEQDDTTGDARRVAAVSLLEPPDADEARAQAAAANPRVMPPFAGLRTADYKYVEYDSGERELYDLRADVYELQNLAGSADRALIERLSSWLDALSHCAGATCRSIEQAPR